MKTKTIILSIFVSFCFVFITWLPCQAAPPNKPLKYQLACVTANIGTDLVADIAYQKNITNIDPSEVFEIWKGDVNQEGGYKFGASCKNDWVMVSCTQSDGEPLDIDIKQDIGCARDEAILNDPANIYVTCCKIM